MIRILIVDDSKIEAALLKHIIEPELDMIVIGIANNGQEAIDSTERLKPDLITMDIQMPVMDGLEATRIIMSQYPTPIVVISSAVSSDSIEGTFPILDAGALMAIAKPYNVLAPSFAESRKYIIDTLRSMAEVNVIKKKVLKKEAKKIEIALPQARVHHYELVAIGASIGGPASLKIILAALPLDFPVPIVIVQHMRDEFMDGFIKWIGETTARNVQYASNNAVLEKGIIYVAPAGKQMEVVKRNDQLMSKLMTNPPVGGFLPAITVMLQSVAKNVGKKAIGLLLTGMGSDGAEGLLALKNAKGLTLVQDPDSAVVFGIGGVALKLGAVDKVIELDKIADYLIQAIQ